MGTDESSLLRASARTELEGKMWGEETAGPLYEIEGPRDGLNAELSGGKSAL